MQEDYADFIEHCLAGNSPEASPSYFNLLRDVFEESKKRGLQIAKVSFVNQADHWVHDCIQENVTAQIERLNKTHFWETLFPKYCDQLPLVQILSKPVWTKIKDYQRSLGKQSAPKLESLTHDDYASDFRLLEGLRIESLSLQRFQYSQSRPRPGIVSACLLAYLGEKIKGRDQDEVFEDYLGRLALSDKEILCKRDERLDSVMEKINHLEVSLSKTQSKIVLLQNSGIHHEEMAGEEEIPRTPSADLERAQQYRQYSKIIQRRINLREAIKVLAIKILFPLEAEDLQNAFSMTPDAAWKNRQRSSERFLEYLELTKNLPADSVDSELYGMIDESTLEETYEKATEELRAILAEPRRRSTDEKLLKTLEESSEPDEYEEEPKDQDNDEFD